MSSDGCLRVLQQRAPQLLGHLSLRIFLGPAVFVRSAWVLLLMLVSASACELAR